MKLITYVRMGKVCFGAVKGSGIIDLTGRIELNVNSIKDLLKLDLLTKVNGQDMQGSLAEALGKARFVTFESKQNKIIKLL